MSVSTSVSSLMSCYWILICRLDQSLGMDFTDLIGLLSSNVIAAYGTLIMCTMLLLLYRI